MNSHVCTESGLPLLIPVIVRWVRFINALSAKESAFIYMYKLCDMDQVKIIFCFWYVIICIFIGWSVQEVNQNFLERAGLGYMAEMFSVNKINGKCLMLLTEVHVHLH